MERSRPYLDDSLKVKTTGLCKALRMLKAEWANKRKGLRGYPVARLHAGIGREYLSGFVYDAEVTLTMAMKNPDELPICVDYEVKDRDGVHAGKIELEYRPCHFGGMKIFFLCEASLIRSSTLYWIGHKFVSRTITNGGYRVWGMSQTDRARARADKAFQRTGLKEANREYRAFWNKPKRMHCSTFSRLMTDYINKQAIANQMVAYRAMRGVSICQAACNRRSAWKAKRAAKAARKVSR